MWKDAAFKVEHDALIDEVCRGPTSHVWCHTVDKKFLITQRFTVHNDVTIPKTKEIAVKYKIGNYLYGWHNLFGCEKLLRYFG